MNIAAIRYVWLRKYYRLRRKWLTKRIPSQNQIKLNINNTFILPSGFGWSIIGIATCLFVLGTNFQNNTMLLLCFFLFSLVFLSLFHSFFFFAQHTLHFHPVKPDYQNRSSRLPIEISSSKQYCGGKLVFSVNKQNLSLQNGVISTSQSPKTVTVNLTHTNTELASGSQHLKLPLPRFYRGLHRCPQITVSTTYGFGLFTCWSHLTPDMELVVYPSIKKAPMVLHHTTQDLELAESSDSQQVISDNLQGIREYQITDPMHHVSWKHVAKGQGMLSKDFTENKGVSGWLRLQDFGNVNLEDALSYLCYQIQELDKDHVQFGLDLGITQILPQQGREHLQHCLLQLACYAHDSSMQHAYNEAKDVR
ncbi:MAG: DUF58 domain-containing protein [Glaciecola sp.]